jgi:hypothetical protein
MELRVEAGEFSVCRLHPAEPLPAWAQGPGFSSVTRTAEELSIVCPSARVPAGIRAESGWKLLRFAGTFDFGAVGVLASVTAPLAEAGISLLALGTFDTDYVLIKAARLDEAARSLATAGHTLSGV